MRCPRLFHQNSAANLHFDSVPVRIPDPRPKTLGEVEREMIQSALQDCNWKIEGDSGAAMRLAMAPSTLRERIKKYGLERSSAESRLPASEF